MIGFRWTLAALLMLATGMAAGQGTPGKVTIVGKQMGASIEAEFRKFTAQVQIDPASPASGKATIEVDIASVDIGIEDYNQELRSKTWFDAKSHPKASFVSSAIKAGAGGRIDVSGKLTIKGKTQDVSVPVTVKTEGNARIFEGVLPIKRSAFGVGEGEWKDTAIVADEVQVRFRIATPQK